MQCLMCHCFAGRSEFLLRIQSSGYISLGRNKRKSPLDLLILTLLILLILIIIIIM